MKRLDIDLSISDNDILTTLKNLHRIDEKQGRLFESRKALLRELAFAISKGGRADADTIQNNYLSAFSTYTPDKKLWEGVGFFSGISIHDQLMVCRYITELLGNSLSFAESVLGQAEPCPERAKGRISYVKNNYTDSAYLLFSSALRSPRCSYSDSFETICEDVYNGESEFCILPIETSTDGKLFSFYSLIDRYELKITAVCSVEHPGGGKITDFALLARSLSLPLKNKKTDLMMELRVYQSLDQSAGIYDIFKAADACRMPLVRVDSIALPYGNGLLSHYAVFSLSPSRLDELLTYLALEFPQCYVTGIYTKIKG